MKIINIKTTPVNIPLELPFLWSVGLYPGATKIIIEVETDEGITGLGEAPSFDCLSTLKENLIPKLLGMDAFDIAACEQRCVPETKVAVNTDDCSTLKAFGGIEMALWDLRGKAWQQPLYMLLGGAIRKEIPFSEYFALRPSKGDIVGESTAKEIGTYCAKMHELYGSTFFEGKCAPGDVDLTVAMVKEISEAVGNDAVIRLDANMGFSLTATRRLLAKLEPYNIDNIEDPAATFDEMAKLRQHSPIPFSSHVPDIRLAARLGVPDNICLNITQLGGIGKTLKCIAACEQFGLGFWFYSGDSGVASAAYLHLAAAVQHCHQPSQSLFRWQTNNVIEEDLFNLQNNVVSVPKGYGLGVTLSPSNLRYCHELFKKEGPYDHYRHSGSSDRYLRLPLC